MAVNNLKVIDGIGRKLMHMLLFWKAVSIKKNILRWNLKWL